MDCVSLPYSAIHYLYSHYDHHSCDQKEEALRTFKKQLIPAFDFSLFAFVIAKVQSPNQAFETVGSKKNGAASRAPFFNPSSA
ncbi:hypothetical protein [Bacillus haynesii]|uniref:hypothetical protein n=1 Tax=Bacillus haynesii TaxID=1925021 RepID=UPI00227F7A80|nr:hypothetical protein [Bacillus haynesii]MCY7777085.1 hypothetical protein [Bacillus haynesii]MCY8240027.1 hypothetical protein [Bacillus haynesii]MCY8370870.1 hypothetical protein [Bacillus haynesii]MCY8568155.1 hypothetical protein [Bacillus haynesii]MCY8671452.1 hypothetical protein [Bacillus haynesii]